MQLFMLYCISHTLTWCICVYLKKFLFSMMIVKVTTLEVTEVVAALVVPRVVLEVVVVGLGFTLQIPIMGMTTGVVGLIQGLILC